MATKKKSLPVYLVDDDPQFHRLIKILLESIKVDVISYSDGETFIQEVSENFYGCLLLDIRMPGCSGLEVQQQLVKRKLDIPIIFVTGFKDVQTTIHAFKNGAQDLFTKPINEQMLIESIQCALKSDKKRMQSQKEYVTLQARVDLLSPREKQVLNLVVKGLSNKKVASKLGITIKTVEAHRSKIMRKLRVNSLAELVKLALRYGYLEDVV